MKRFLVFLLLITISSLVDAQELLENPDSIKLKLATPHGKKLNPIRNYEKMKQWQSLQPLANTSMAVFISRNELGDVYQLPGGMPLLKPFNTTADPHQMPLNNNLIPPGKTGTSKIPNPYRNQQLIFETPDLDIMKK